MSNDYATNRAIAILDNILPGRKKLPAQVIWIASMIRNDVTAAEQRGIERARRAVENIPHGTSWFGGFIEDALAAIDALTEAPETEGGGDEFIPRSYTKTF